MKKTIALAFLLLALVRPARANQAHHAICEQSGQVSTASIASTNPAELSYPLCQVIVYYHGTTTKAPLSSDNSGTPLGNPFTAQNGVYFFFYAPNGHYDYTMSGGPQSMPATSVSDLFLYDAGNGVTVDCTNPAYGFTAEIGGRINNCINALPSSGGIADARGFTGTMTMTTNFMVGVTKPVTVLFGTGTYTVSGAAAQVIVPSNTRIICNGGSNGGGTKFINSTGLASANIAGLFEAASYSGGGPTNGIEIAGCTIDNNGMGQSTSSLTAAIHLRGSYNSIHDNYIFDSKATGSTTCGPSGACMSGVRIEGVPASATSSTENDVTNNTILNAYIGVTVAGLSHRTTISRNRLVNDYEAFDLNGDAISGQSGNSAANIVVNNHIENVAIPSFLQTASYSIVQGNTFSGAINSSVASYLVAFTALASGDYTPSLIVDNTFGDPTLTNPVNCVVIENNISGFTFSNNFVRSCGHDGLLLTGTGANQSPVDGVVSGNVFSSNGTASCNLNWGGIGIAPSTGGLVSRIVITGNRSYDVGAIGFGGAPSPCQGWGIRLGTLGTINQIRIWNNDLTQNTQGAITAGNCAACNIGPNAEDGSGVSFVRSVWNFLASPTFPSGMPLPSPALTTPSIGAGPITLVQKFNLSSSVVGGATIAAGVCSDFGLSPNDASALGTDTVLVSPNYPPQTGADTRVTWSGYAQLGVNLYARICNPTASSATLSSSASFTLWLFR